MLTRCSIRNITPAMTPTSVPMTDLSSQVDRLLNEVFAGFTPEAVPVFAAAKPFPALNIWHDDGAFYLEAELPGFSMNDIEINLTGKELTLTATRRTSERSENVGEFVRRERAEGTFSRTVRLPAPIDAERVGAKLVNGVLTVTLPKAAEALPRRITVRSA